MKNLYIDSIEKIATQAWKKHFADLGEESIKRLEASGVLNRGKELKGLRVGTKKILGKENSKMFRQQEKYLGHTMESVKQYFGLTPKMKEYGQTRQQLKDMGVSGNALLSHSKWDKSGGIFTPKNSRKEVNSVLNNMGVEPSTISRKDRESKKWVQALLERHEADEIRHGRKVMKNPKLMADYEGQQIPTTRFATHITPKVVTSESANLALAPEGAKNYFYKMRNIGSSGNTEIDALKQYGNNFDYGKSPIFDKKRSRLLEKNISKETKEWL